MSTGGSENTVARSKLVMQGAKPLLGSAITGRSLPNGGAWAKPLLGSAMTIPWLPIGGYGRKTPDSNRSQFGELVKSALHIWLPSDS